MVWDIHFVRCHLLVFGIHSYKELYSISIDEGDPLFKPLNMDNRSYCRINGKWHYNSGGSELDWRKMKNKEEVKLIEDVFSFI